LKIITFLLITTLQLLLINTVLAKQVSIKHTLYQPAKLDEIKTAQSSEKIAITSSGNQITLQLETDINSYSTVKITNEQQVAFEDSGKNIQLDGYCQTSEENSLAFIFSASYDGIGVPFRYAAIQSQTKPSEWQHLSLHESDNEMDTISAIPTDISEVSCTGTQISRVVPNETTLDVELCLCDFSKVNASNEIKSELMSFIPAGEIALNFHSDEALSVNSNFTIELVPLKRSAAEFEDFIEKMKAPSTPVLVEHIKLKNSEFLQISDVDRPLYQKYAYSFVKLAGAWQLFYQAQQSSKGFYPLFGLKRINDSSLGIEEMCINRCDWGGSHRQVEINFITNQLNIITID
jgi:hypothetical protein